MGRWRGVVLVLSLMLASCSGSGTDNSSSTTTGSSTTTTDSTTTTEVAEEVCAPTPLEGRPRVWEEGCDYSTSGLGVSLTFTAPASGWTSSGAGDQWVEIRHDSDGDGAYDVSLTLLLYEAQSPPAEIMDEIVSIDGVDLIDGPRETSVHGNTAVVADVLGQEDPNTATELPQPCSQPRGTARLTDVVGYPLFVDPANAYQTFGIPACFTTRAWVIDVGGTTITALGVVKDNERFDELMPILEDFLQNNVTFGDGADG